MCVCVRAPGGMVMCMCVRACMVCVYRRGGLVYGYGCMDAGVLSVWVHAYGYIIYTEWMGVWMGVWVSGWISAWMGEWVDT